jgi:hypothetical protein
MLSPAVRRREAIRVRAGEKWKEKKVGVEI